MQNLVIVILFLLCNFLGYAQKSHYDSIRRMMQQDSIEYEQELKDVDKIKKQTDSILQKDLGHIERITPGPDTSTIRENLRALAAQEIQKQNEEASRQYYFFVVAFAVFLIAVIVIFKLKQFNKEERK